LKKEIVLGKGGIKFIKRIVEYEIRHPEYNFRRVKQTIEYRRDPIAKYWSRVNRDRARRPEQAADFDEEKFEYFALSVAKKCPFCFPRVYNNTPMFISEYIDAGRLEREVTIVFPNAYPFAIHHAVGIFRSEHYVRLDEIRGEDIATALFAYREYFKVIHSKDPKARYMSINMNFLPPSGASIIHPHMQIFIDYVPTEMMKRLFYYSKKYYRKYKSNPWVDLVESEKHIGDRFIVTGNVLSWIASFSPLANKEVIGIATDSSSNFVKLSDDEIEGMGEDIANMLNAFYNIGVKSVNMTIFTAPINRDWKFFKINVRIVARKNPAMFYTNDRAFMEIFHREVVITSLPEELANKLRIFY